MGSGCLHGVFFGGGRGEAGVEHEDVLDRGDGLTAL